MTLSELSTSPQQTFAKSVRERDLDHFLIEELQASPDFREWFVRHLNGFTPPRHTCAKTQRSPQRLTDSRQTDLWLAYYDRQTVTAVVLIESKVADDLRTGQAEAYAREVAALRKQLGAKCAASVLAAPIFNPVSKTEHFDAFIAVDHMADFLKQRCQGMGEGELRERMLIRIDLLEALAGRRADSVWTPVPVREKLQLAALYDQLVRQRLAGYRVSQTSAARRAKDRFFDQFPNASLFNGDVRLKHRLYNGLACLEFRNCKLTKADLDGLSLPAKLINAEWTGRQSETLQLQIQVPALNDTDDALIQEKTILNCLGQIEMLTDWFSNNLDALNAIVGRNIQTSVRRTRPCFSA